MDAKQRSSPLFSSARDSLQLLLPPTDCITICMRADKTKHTERQKTIMLLCSLYSSSLKTQRERKSEGLKNLLRLLHFHLLMGDINRTQKSHHNPLPRFLSMFLVPCSSGPAAAIKIVSSDWQSVRYCEKQRRSNCSAFKAEKAIRTNT
ncbi:hypothetical protein HPP92_006279 [Vanilla planifolia]|uniref:Uncharacterized protein n=1 Tax=Vanilla planifolia TaxID=51239 RepID=A0A835RVJ5_VANPL|nr:hypothetical protein HPP92_006279 [Vanilla planifolia]